MEGFTLNLYEDNSKEENDGFKYLILDNMWIMKHELNLSRMT